MNVCSWLATWLDWEMLVQRGVAIEPPTTPIALLHRKTGSQVADELGGRYLIRYLLVGQVGLFSRGTRRLQYVTPTPYAPSETVSYLALPNPTEPRPYALVLDPSQISFIWGPQWIRGGQGVQYVLRNGFPQRAIVVPGTRGASWEIQVR